MSRIDGLNWEQMFDSAQRPAVFDARKEISIQSAYTFIAMISLPDLGHEKLSLEKLVELAKQFNRPAGVAFLARLNLYLSLAHQSDDPTVRIQVQQKLSCQVTSSARLQEIVRAFTSRGRRSYQRKQNPVLANTVQGLVILGDFTAPLLLAPSMDLDEYPVARLEFHEVENGTVQDVLTNIKRWTYTQKYLEKVVNENLHEYFKDRLGRFAARLSAKAKIPLAEIVVEDAGLLFPDGGYSISHEAYDKKKGIFHHGVSFEREWFDRPDQMVQILECLEMSPEEVKFELSEKRQLESMVAAIQARGWRLESQLLPKEFVANRGSIRVHFTPTAIRFEGFLPGEILGSQADPDQQSLLESVLRLLPKPR